MTQSNPNDQQRFLPGLGRMLLILISVFIISLNAHADKPEKDNDKGNSGKGKQEQQDGRGQKEDKGEKKYKGEKSSGKQQGNGGLNASVSFGFRGEDTRLVREYYGSQAAKGNCPPGLAKKGNGCQPPGQAKKWQRGKPLGSDVPYYDIPNELRIRLPVPPLDHRYVLSGTDLLLIQVGTAIVVDAITDIF